MSVMKGVFTVLLLTVLTACGYYFWNMQTRPSLPLAQARAVFEKYPYWQSNIFRSDEVVFDTKLAAQHQARFAIPTTLGKDDFSIWQPKRTEVLRLEFGAGRMTDVPTRDAQ